MSRIGKQPVTLAKGVELTIDGSTVKVKGPKGELTRTFPAGVRISVEDGKAVVTRPDDEKRSRALHGLSRSLLANMVTGVSEGYTRTLELQGVGYRATQAGKAVTLAVGYSHPVEVTPPPGIELEVEGTTKLHVRGIDKELVGQVAANIRKVRKPEPYKGKGIRYLGEYVRRKAGKAGKAGK
ncbi:MAG TPA: 50S ribosomal protein L6 [Dehalococcoidia bacterium]|nr:50S ribosomal protein L6 [Dehalococcoidia bacterium]